MKNSIIQKCHLVSLMFMTMLLCMAVSVPAFASNKAISYQLNFNGRSYSETDGEDAWNKCTYYAGIYTTGKTKVKNTMEFSGDFIVPAKMLTNKKSYIQIQPNIIINKTNKSYDWIATFQHSRAFLLKNAKNIWIYNEKLGDNESPKKVKQYMTAEKKGGYYIVHFRDVIKLSDSDPKLAKKLVDKYYNIGFEILVNGPFLKSGKVYFDNLKIKVANKTIKVDFDKNDCRGYGYNYRDKYEYNSSKAKIVNSPV